jgi:hypothetical protein
VKFEEMGRFVMFGMTFVILATNACDLRKIWICTVSSRNTLSVVGKIVFDRGFINGILNIF